MMNCAEPPCHNVRRCRPPPHIQQRHEWDCGIACIAMLYSAVLRSSSTESPTELRDDPHSIYDIVMEEWTRQCPTDGCAPCESVWTIDLFFLIHRLVEQLPHPRNLSVQLQYCTKQIEISSTYASMPFYQSNLKEDTKRVVQLFHTAQSSGWDIRECHLDVSDIVSQLVRGDTLFVALVNVFQLQCTCQHGEERKSAGEGDEVRPSSSESDEGRGGAPTSCCASIRKCAGIFGGVVAAAASSLPSLYVGHYILLCGYDAVRQRVRYRNPCSSVASGSFCWEGLANFDSARRAIGTDEDLIVMRLQTPR